MALTAVQLMLNCAAGLHAWLKCQKLASALMASSPALVPNLRATRQILQPIRLPRRITENLVELGVFVLREAGGARWEKLISSGKSANATNTETSNELPTGGVKRAALGRDGGSKASVSAAMHGRTYV